MYTFFIITILKQSQTILYCGKIITKASKNKFNINKNIEILLKRTLGDTNPHKQFCFFLQSFRQTI